VTHALMQSQANTRPALSVLSQRACACACVRMRVGALGAGGGGGAREHFSVVGASAC